jgi:tetratricopeptide (TPR) repeat protein
VRKTPRRQGRQRRRLGLAHALVWAGLLVGASGLTAWHATYSPALAEANALYANRPDADSRPAWLQQIENLVQDARSVEPARRRRAPSSLPTSSQPDFRTALQRALDHLSKHPAEPAACRIAGLCLSRLDYANEAEPYYALARKHNRLTVDDLSVRAMGLARGNQREAAIAAFLEILELRPDDDETLQRLAATYYSQSRYKDALAVANRLTRSPTQRYAVAGYALVGVVHHDEHRPAEAVVAYEQVLALDPQLALLTLPSSLFFTDFAQDLIDVGRAGDARAYVRRRLGSSDDPALLNVLGLAELADGMQNEAELSWKRATEVDPKFHKPWLNLGKLALRRARTAEAVAYLERAHALDRRSFEPSYQLSLAYRRLGRATDADRFRKLADSLRRGDPRTGTGMGTTPNETP